MIRLFSLALCTALITLPAFAYEGPQEQELDRSLAQMQDGGTSSSNNVYAAPLAPQPKQQPAPNAKVSPHEGANELRMDEGLQPEGGSDPAGDAMVRKLNGGL